MIRDQHQEHAGRGAGAGVPAAGSAPAVAAGERRHGAHVGGDGIERDLEVLVDVTVSLITERRRVGPWGLAGGGSGAPGVNWLLPGGDEDRAEPLPDKCTIQLQAGDVLRMLTPGGGGWGLPPEV